MILWCVNLNWLTWSVALISTYSQKAYPLDSDVALSFTRLKALRGPNDVRSSLTCTTVEDVQVCEHNSSCSSNPIHILSIEPRMGVYKMAGPIERNSGFWKLKSHSLSPKRNRDFFYFLNYNVTIQWFQWTEKCSWIHSEDRQYTHQITNQTSGFYHGNKNHSKRAQQWLPAPMRHNKWWDQSPLLKYLNILKKKNIYILSIIFYP